MSLPHLILGNARYSSWSMRPWLVFKRAGIEFTSEFLPLRTDETRARMAKVSPFALVPLVGHTHLSARSPSASCQNSLFDTQSAQHKGAPTPAS